jgi:hypothetical protein
MQRKSKSKPKPKSVRFAEHYPSPSIIQTRQTRKSPTSDYLSPLIRHEVNVTRNRITHMKNKECNEDFFYCLGRKLNNIKYVGGGTFGQILKGTGLDGNEYGIKFIIKKIKKGETDTILFNEMEKELDLIYYMGDVNIGPKLKKTFYYIVNEDDIRKKHDLNELLGIIIKSYALKHQGKIFSPLKYSKNDYWWIQCIVMDVYDTDCDNALASNIPENAKLEIIRQMCMLIYIQNFRYDIYCYDIKPGNFVVNMRNKIDVRMIDFGTDFCKKRYIYNRNYYNQNLASQKIDLYISNILQITMMLYNNYNMYKLPNKVKDVLFELHPMKEFSKLNRSAIRTYLDNYVRSGVRVLYNGEPADPSSNLLWYAFSYDYSNINNISEAEINRMVNTLMSFF